MTVTIDGVALPTQPVTVRWHIRPVGTTGSGTTVLPFRTGVRLTFILSPMATGSSNSLLVDAFDNMPHSFVLPHPVTRVDTLYTGVFVRSIDYSIANKSDNKLASVVVTLANVRFRD